MKFADLISKLQQFDFRKKAMLRVVVGLISAALLPFGILGISDASFAETVEAAKPSHPEPKTQSDTLLIPSHKWIASPPRNDASAFFTNLENGDSVTSPFVVKFGMSFWGIVPAAHKHARTGHHHLLIDTRLPIAYKDSLPFSKNYVHFGKGQMETVLDLPQGKHTLRLLLADYNHVPHMVFSREIEINVIGNDPARAEKFKSSPPELSFPNLRDGEQVKSYFRIQFHASKLNIANKLAKLPDTGYFQLAISGPLGRELIPFPGGQTETWLKLPVGDYTLLLRYLKNPSDEPHSLSSKELLIHVRE